MAALRQVVDEYIVRTELQGNIEEGAAAGARALERIERNAIQAAEALKLTSQAAGEGGRRIEEAAGHFDRFAERHDKLTRAQKAVDQATRQLVAAQEAGRRALEAGDATAEQVQRTLDAMAAKVQQAAARLGELRAEYDAAEAAHDAWNGSLSTGVAELGQWSSAVAASAQAARAQKEAVEDAARASQRALAAQAAYNQVLGVKTGGETEYARRAADIAAFGVEMDRLRAKYDPLFAASKRYELVLEEIADAERKGALSARVAEEARSRATVAFNDAVGPAQKFAAANENVAGKMGRVREVMGQAGYQIQDFLVQVQGGQNALVALGQQGSQMLGVFGAGGAIAGAALVVGTFAAQLVLAAVNGKALDDVLKDIDASSKLADEAAQRRVNGLEDEAERLNRLAAAYRDYSAAALAGERARLTLEREKLDKSTRSMLSSVDSGFLGLGSLRGSAAFSGLSSQDDAMRPAEKAALDQLTALNDVAIITRERVLEVAGALRTAAQANGPFAAGLNSASEALLGQIGPLTEAGEKARSNAAILRILEEASGAASGGFTSVGTAASGTAGQVGTLNGALDLTRQRLLALSQQRVENPFEDVQESLGRLNAQRQALENGGTEALASERRRQTALAQVQTRTEADEAKLRKALIDANTAAEEIERRLAAARPEFQRLRQEEADSQAGLMRAEEERRKKEEEGRRAASAARTAARREEAADARDRMAELRMEQQIYADLQRTPSGLLAIGRADEAAIREIQQTTKRTALDPEHVRKQADEANRIATRAYETQAREAERIYDRVVDHAGNTFADMLTNQEKSWSQTWKSLEKTALATLAKIAFEALARPVIMPIIQSVQGMVGGGAAAAAGAVAAPAGTGLAGLTGGGTAAGGTGVMGAVQEYGGLFDSSLFGGSQNFSSGMIGRFDGFAGTKIAGFLDRPLYTAPNLGLGGSEMAGLGGGPNMVAGASEGASVSIGQAAGGALGIVGGAYGLYNAFQTGGGKGIAQGIGSVAGIAGGAATMAGGAAAGGMIAGVAAVAPYVAIAALIASYFLSGQKPSDMTGTSLVDFSTGQQSEGGLSGKRFSQENRDLATAMTTSLRDFAGQLNSRFGVQVGGSMMVAAGARDGLMLHSGGQHLNFKNDEGGAKELLQEATRRILEGIGGQLTGNLATTYRNVGTADSDKLLGALDWTQTTYAAFERALNPSQPTAWEQSIRGVNDTFGTFIAKATEFGLSLDPINAQLTKTLAAMDQARRAEFNLALDEMRVQAAQLRGGDTSGIRLAYFDRQRTADWLAGSESWRQKGFGDAEVEAWTREFDAVRDVQRAAIEAEGVAARKAAGELATLSAELGRLGLSAARLGETAAQQAAAIERARGTATGVVSSLAEYARGLRTGDASPYDARTQYGMALRDFRAVSGAAAAGDWTSITKLQAYSDTLLETSKMVNGEGAGYVSDFEAVQRALQSVADLGADRLTASVLVAEFRTQTQTLASEIQALRAEVAAGNAAAAHGSIAPAERRAP